MWVRKMRNVIVGILMSITWIGALLAVLEADNMAVRLLVLLSVAPISLVLSSALTAMGNGSSGQQAA